MRYSSLKLFTWKNHKSGRLCFPGLQPSKHLVIRIPYDTPLLSDILIFKDPINCQQAASTMQSKSFGQDVKPALYSLGPGCGSFSKERDPSKDPKILQSLFSGPPKKATPNFGKPPFSIQGSWGSEGQTSRF